MKILQFCENIMITWLQQYAFPIRKNTGNAHISKHNVTEKNCDITEQCLMTKMCPFSWLIKLHKSAGRGKYDVPSKPFCKHVINIRTGILTFLWNKKFSVVTTIIQYIEHKVHTVNSKRIFSCNLYITIFLFFLNSWRKLFHMFIGILFTVNRTLAIT